MQRRTQAQLRSGSRARTDTATGEHEWRDAEAAERLEVGRETAQRTQAAVWILPTAALSALLPAILPLTPGFSAADTSAAVVAAIVTAVVAVAIVPLGAVLGRGFSAADGLVFAVALLSAGAAAIHFAVAKSHFDEYTLFGVFFVGAGIAQLAWSIWVLLRRWRPLFVLGALGNGLIVALWAVARIWGLPLGPEHWEPETVGFGDSVTAAFELLVVAGCVMLLVRAREQRLRVGAAVPMTLGVTALTALGLLSVLAVGSSFLTPTA
jgi:hypothetical protein